MLNKADYLKMSSMERLWNTSFVHQIKQGAYNSAPVEAIVRSVSHHFRAKGYTKDDRRKLKFLEVGCGAGANLGWLAEQGVRISGIDISQEALSLCRKVLKHKGLGKSIDTLAHGSASDVACPDEHFDGIIESCVFQHLPRELRIRAFSEVVRLLKPGGLFIGHMLSRKHSTYKDQVNNMIQKEPGTLFLIRENTEEKINLEDIGLTHFFTKSEIKKLLKGCSIINPCESVYELPKVEANRRGYDYYQHAMWIVYAVK